MVTAAYFRIKLSHLEMVVAGLFVHHLALALIVYFYANGIIYSLILQAG